MNGVPLRQLRRLGWSESHGHARYQNPAATTLTNTLKHALLHACMDDGSCMKADPACFREHSRISRLLLALLLLGSRRTGEMPRTAEADMDTRRGPVTLFFGDLKPSLLTPLVEALIESNYDVDVLEVHDCFSIAEMLMYEARAPLR